MNKATVRAKLVSVDCRPVDEPRNRMDVSGAVRRITDWGKGEGNGYCCWLGRRTILLLQTG
jgi:hypothetical protein